MTVKTTLGGQTKKYKPPPKILRDEDRTVTDGYSRILFCVISSIWLAFCICALSCSSVHEHNEALARNITHPNPANTKNIIHHDSITNITNLNTTISPKNHHSTTANNIAHDNSTAKNETNWLNTDGWLKKMLYFYVDRSYHLDLSIKDRVSSIIFWTSIIFYSSLLLLAMKIMHKWAILSPAAFIVMSSTLMVISTIHHVINYFVNDVEVFQPLYKRFLYWIGPEAILLLISILTFFKIMHSAGRSKMMNLLKKTFRFYVKCRYLLIIGSLTCAIIVLLNIFSAKVLKNASYDSAKSRAFYAFIYCGSCYLILVVHALGRMIMSATVASYYWNESDQESPFKEMCRKIVSITKYQFGSACDKAFVTSVWFIPLISGLLGYEFDEYRTAYGYFLIFDLLQLLAFDNTIFLIGMFGVSASDAFDLYFYLFRKVSRYFAVVCQGLWSATFIILMPTNCIMLILMWGLNEDNEIFSFLSTKAYVEVILVSIPITFVLGTIEDSRILCIMKDKADKKELKAEAKSLKEPIEVKVDTDSDVKNQN